jgi:hypothetical protein
MTAVVKRLSDRISPHWRPSVGTTPHRALMCVDDHGPLSTRTVSRIIGTEAESAMRYLALAGLIENDGSGWVITESGEHELADPAPPRRPKPRIVRETRTAEERDRFEQTRYEDDPDVQRFIEEHPDGAMLDEIGAYLGVSRERVRQLETEALVSLARGLRRAGVTEATETGIVCWYNGEGWCE